MGRALLQHAGLLAARRQLPGHAHARMGHGRRRPRLAELADWPPQHQVRRRLSELHLAHVGLLPESRLLPVHQRLHHRSTRSTTAAPDRRWPASCSACRPRARARPAFRRWTCASGTQTATRRTPGASPRNTTLTYGLRYEFMSPLVDIRYTNSNLDLSSGAPQVFIGGQNGYPRGLMYANRHQLRTPARPGAELASSGPRGACRIWNLLHPGRHEHLVQSAPQRAVRLPVDLAERSIHSQHSPRSTSLPRCWANTTVVSFTGLAVARAGSVHPAVEHLSREAVGLRNHARNRLPRRRRIPSAAFAPHQQRATRTGPHSAAPPASHDQLRANTVFPSTVTESVQPSTSFPSAPSTCSRTRRRAGTTPAT